MAADRVLGPHPPLNASDKRGGGFQFAALAAETKIKLPLEWRGEYVRLVWKPDTDGDVLEYLFVPDQDPLPAIDNTDSGGTEPDFTIVDRAPDFIESGAVDEIVPNYGGDTATVLILKPAGQGRSKVRQAEGWATSRSR